MRNARVATYRLQFRTGMGFREAAAIAPYLARLGISHLYASPDLQGAQRLHPRLRPRRPQRARPGARRPRRLRALSAALRATASAC